MHRYANIFTVYVDKHDKVNQLHAMTITTMTIT